MSLPPDLCLALLIITLISAGLFALAARLGKRRIGIPAAIIAVGVLLAYALWLCDNPIIIRLLPVRNVMLWGNPQLPLAGVLSGIAWARMRGPQGRKLILVTALLGVSTWRELGPLLGKSPVLHSRYWTDGVCRQMSQSSCSAAAAATLLAQCHINTTESEMSELCLTCVEGTSSLGVYRGLVIKTAGTPWTVGVYSTQEDITRWPFPVLVNVRGLDQNLVARHTVVAFGLLPDGMLDVGDPSVGRESWPRADMIAFSNGQMYALIPRH